MQFKFWGSAVLAASLWWRPEELQRTKARASSRPILGVLRDHGSPTTNVRVWARKAGGRARARTHTLQTGGDKVHIGIWASPAPAWPGCQQPCCERQTEAGPETQAPLLSSSSPPPGELSPLSLPVPPPQRKHSYPPPPTRTHRMSPHDDPSLKCPHPRGNFSYDGPRNQQVYCGASLLSGLVFAAA